MLGAGPDVLAEKDASPERVEWHNRCMSESEPRRGAADIGTEIAHPARVYDYWLGGKDNFAADREAAQAVVSVMPEILDTVRGNRDFLLRTVRFLCDAGISQFLDIGSGLPHSPDVHEVAQPGSSVVYVDNDPIVYSHTQMVTAKVPGTGFVFADLRDVDRVLAEAGKLLDRDRPTGLVFAGSLHHIVDADDPAGVVARYLDALAPGSYVVISHVTGDFSPEKMRANADVAESSGAVLIPRSKDEIMRLFNGRRLVDPGLVQVSYWRPDGGDPGPNADRAWAYGGAAVS
jgi:SAM-dependent methyltransferase